VRTLISGGAGFLGIWLQDSLRRAGHSVVAPSSRAWDVCDAAQTHRVFEDVRPEWFFHLASVTRHQEILKDPERCMSVQVGGTRTVMEAAREETPTARIVVVSSCHVYGGSQGQPLRETDPLRPTGVYGQSKLAQEREALGACGGPGEPDVVIARPFHLVGPGQPLAFAPADWAAQAASGASTIQVGNLDLERDYLDVRDAASGLVLLAEAGVNGEAYNLCRGEAVPLRWVLSQVAQGVKAVAEPGRMRGPEITSLVGDSGRLNALGWAADVDLARSLAELRAEMPRGAR